MDKLIKITRKEKAYIEVLKSIQGLSTCARLKVSALLVKDGRIIATGWNGVSSGMEHCEDKFKKLLKDNSIDEETFFKYHHDFSTRYELHAEQNLVSFCARNGVRTEGCQIYLTHSPCIHCSKILYSSGINWVKFLIKYDRDDSGISFLKENEISCYELEGEEEWKML